MSEPVKITTGVPRGSWLWRAALIIALAVGLAVHFDNRRTYRESQATVVILQQKLGEAEASLADRLKENRELRGKLDGLTRQ